MGEDASAARRFRSEAAEAWKTYLNHTKSIVGEYEAKDTRFGKLQSHVRAEIKQNSDCHYYRLTTLFPPPKKMHKSFAWAVNKDYAFNIVTSNPTLGWAVKTVRLDQKGKELFEKDHFAANQSNFDNLLKVDNILLPELAAKSYFKILDANFVQLEGREFVEIKFEALHDTKDRDGAVQSGVLVLDPANLWCIRHANLETLSYPSPSTPLRAKVELDYSYRSENGIPIPETIVERSKFPSGKIEYVHAGKRQLQSWPSGESETRIDCELRLALVISDDDFYLTAFGLPEPNGMPARDKPTPWQWWLLVGGVTMLALGYLVSRSGGSRTAPS